MILGGMGLGRLYLSNSLKTLERSYLGMLGLKDTCFKLDGVFLGCPAFVVSDTPEHP